MEPLTLTRTLTRTLTFAPTLTLTRWTLGILLYEMLVGNPPFAADNQMDIYHKIMRGKYKIPSHFPKAAKEIVSRLLSSNPAARLGCLKSGSKQVLQHDFFRSIDWRKLEAKEVRVP